MTPVDTFRVLTPSSEPAFVMGQRVIDQHDLPLLGGIDVRAAVRYLKDAGVAPDHENCWHAYVHPDVEFDLLGDDSIVRIAVENLEKQPVVENPLLAGSVPAFYSMKFHRWMKDTEIPVGPYNVYTGSTVEENRGQIYRTAFGITPA